MKKMCLLTLALAALAIPSTAAAQAPAAATAADTLAVKAVVIKLFDAMRSRDTASLSSVFHPAAYFYGINPRGEVERTAPADFVKSIAAAPAGMVLDEVLHDVEVRIDGPLATVWTYYDFFAGDNFSHCGYDAFTLLNTGEGWKIVAVADTRRRVGCRMQRGS